MNKTDILSVNRMICIIVCKVILQKNYLFILMKSYLFYKNEIMEEIVNEKFTIICM